ncbi:hypothetical protein CCMSSC00406_0002618 [Pleurotus cornucopiae]|uniref:Uncharacterized protein n=1 Tax=Pleurotus cornucopiae TaxID=5321 RepID=A0ACB7IR85_PLECO|nr:hypothetical protein CCMSSC00406_0002618 [Pleurotus cornucopiae]
MATDALAPAAVPQMHTATAAPVREEAPVPLSFPAILRNPGVSHRFAHLHADQPIGRSLPVKKSIKRDDNEGKRWVRRKENAHFVDNPHIVHASKADYAPLLPNAKRTFPEPLPAYLPRTVKAPDTIKPILEPNSANAGRFSLSLKGMRRDLRKAGFRAQILVEDIEKEITEWLQGGAFAASDVSESSLLNFPGTPIGRMDCISEVSRDPLQLIWAVGEDAFARYVVHCCARYYEIVSFSKEVKGRRLTYLLRPNVAHPDSFAPAGLYTPPTTDLDSASQFETDPETDVLSEILAEGNESDAECAADVKHLEDIVEAQSPRPFSPDNDWSVVEGSDIEGDHEGDITVGVEASSIQPTVSPRRPLASRHWTSRQDRSASSPSPSPVRRPARRRMVKRRVVSLRQTHRAQQASFFDYLFA